MKGKIVLVEEGKIQLNSEQSVIKGGGNFWRRWRELRDGRRSSCAQMRFIYFCLVFLENVPTFSWGILYSGQPEILGDPLLIWAAKEEPLCRKSEFLQNEVL